MICQCVIYVRLMLSFYLVGENVLYYMFNTVYELNPGLELRATPIQLRNFAVPDVHVNCLEVFCVIKCLHVA